MDPQTGHITLHKSLPKNPAKYSLKIKAVDDGSCCDDPRTTLTGFGEVSVEVVGINKPPRFKDCSTYKGKILENQPPNTPVINVSILV